MSLGLGDIIIWNPFPGLERAVGLLISNKEEKRGGVCDREHGLNRIYGLGDYWC